MDEDNIYEDLDNFILDEHVGQVQQDNKELLQTIEKLEETTKKFNEEITELKKINKNLERNISALFKTAKNEIERKDKKIAELRRELDNLKFRRGNNKKGQKSDDNNDVLLKEVEKSKYMIEQKNRIIQSLTKELENVRKDLSKQDKNLKRNNSYIEDDDPRNRLSKKRKLDDKHVNIRRPRSRSKSRENRFDSRSKSRFDKKRTIRRNRSGSFEQRRSSITEKHRNKYEKPKYSRSRSRSPSSIKKYSNQFSDKSGRTSNSQYQEKVKKLVSRSRSSSLDRKKYRKYNDAYTDNFDKKIKCDTRVNHNNHLVKEDSGISSCNSHTSELISKCDEVKSDTFNPLTEIKINDLEEGELDCSLEDIHSDEDNSYFKENDDTSIKEDTNITWKTPKLIELEETKKSSVQKTLQNENKITNNSIEQDENMKENLVRDDVLEVMVQSNYLDDLDIDEEIAKMRMFDDDKRKKRKEDKERILKLKSAISECKQNIELLEHNIYSEEETETEDDSSKQGSFIEENIVNMQQDNLVLKISKGSIVKSTSVNEPKITHFKNDKNLLNYCLDKNYMQTIVDKIEDKNKDETTQESEIVTETLIDTNINDNISNKNNECLSINSNIKIGMVNNKIETCVLKEEKSEIKTTKTGKIESKNKCFSEEMKENEHFPTATNIINDTKFEQNFANITNLESVVSEGNNRNSVESEQKENVSLTNPNEEKSINIDKNSENDNIERKAPLKARRRRAFICIT